MCVRVEDAAVLLVVPAAAIEHAWEWIELNPNLFCSPSSLPAQLLSEAHTHLFCCFPAGPAPLRCGELGCGALSVLVLLHAAVQRRAYSLLLQGGRRRAAVLLLRPACLWCFSRWSVAPTACCCLVWPVWVESRIVLCWC